MSILITDEVLRTIQMSDQELRDYQKINYPILWDGHPACPW